jgi:acyl-CoA thioesterase YciA
MRTYEGLSPATDSTLMLQIVANQQNTNTHGDIYAGWLLDQMDSAATLLAVQMSHGRCTTVAVDRIEFLSPVNVGDVVSIYARLQESGRSSMVIAVEVFARNPSGQLGAKVTEGNFTSVAIENDGTIRQLV